MPGLSLWYEPVAADVGPDENPLRMVANSVTGYAGDPVVYTTVTGSQDRLRLLTATDISNAYVDTGVTAGIWGFLPADIATGSAGQRAAVASPLSLAADVAPVYPIPELAGFEPVDPVSGRMQTSVYSCKNWIAGYLWENTTVTQSLIGTAVGLYTSTLAGEAMKYFWSTAAATKVGRIVAVDVRDPLFNTTLTANVLNTTHSPRVLLAVKIYSTLDQIETGNPYTN